MIIVYFYPSPTSSCGQHIYKYALRLGPACSFLKNYYASRATIKYVNDSAISSVSPIRTQMSKLKSNSSWGIGFPFAIAEFASEESLGKEVGLPICLTAANYFATY